MDYLSELKRERIRKKLDKDRKERAGKAREPRPHARTDHDSAQAFGRAQDYVAHRICGHPAFALPALRALLSPRITSSACLRSRTGPPVGVAVRASPVKLLAADAACRSRSLRAKTRRDAPSSGGPRRARGRCLWPHPSASRARICRALGCLNIHGSLLPRWRGAAPIQRAILAGDTETGVTIMQLDAGLDTGPMLLERSRPIGLHDTAGDLHDALAELVAPALIEALDGLAAGTLRAARRSPLTGVSYAPKIEKSEAGSTGRASAIRVDRQVRAFNPWPIAETVSGSETLRVLRARVAERGRRMPRPALC